MRCYIRRLAILAISSLTLAGSTVRAEGINPKPATTPQPINTIPPSNTSLAQQNDPQGDISPLILTQVFHIPPIQNVNYDPSPRDPFLDPSVTNTILEAQKGTVIPKTAVPIETYFAELAELVTSTNTIFGVSFTGPEPMVLFSTGTIGPQGGTFTVKMPPPSTPEDLAKGTKNLTDKMLESAENYGLTLLQQQLFAQTLPIRLRKITTKALVCQIAGSKNSLIIPIKKQPNQVTFGFTNSLKQ